MTRINTNVLSLTAQKSLARSNSQLQESLTRLSTGLRINSGKDDPAGLIASEALRSDITSTNKAISNSQRANQMIATADSALGQVSSLLNDIRGLVTEAANEGGMSDDQIAANQLQVDSALEAINRIAQTTTFQGKKLIDGSLDFLKTWTSGETSVTDLDVQQANLGTTGSMSVSVDITSAATQASITAAIPDAVAAVAATAEFTTNITVADSLTFDAFTDGAEGNKIRIDFVHADTVAADEIVTSYNYDDVNDLHVITVSLNNTTADYGLAAIATAIEGVDDNTGTQLVDVTVNDGGGAMTYDATAAAPATVALEDGADAISGLTGDLVFELRGTQGAQVFSFEQNATGTQMAAAISLVQDATGVSASFAGGTLTLESVGYGTDAVVEIKKISDAGAFTPSASRDTGTDIVAKVNGTAADGKGNTLSINTPTLQMTATVTDGSSTDFAFSINGGGALFQVGPDVVSNQQARMGIQSINTARLGGSDGKLYQLASGKAAALATDANTASLIVDQAITKLASLRGRLGAFQKTTLETNIASLTDTVENLTAAQSSIRDADFAAESANLTRAQILVQAGTQVLSVANQNPQNVLSLLRG